MSSDRSIPEHIGIDEQRIAHHRFGSGPSVVLICGILTSSYLWRNVIRLLVKGLQVIAVDLLGYGDSDKPSDVDLGIANQAKRIAATLRDLDWDGNAIVHHDIGGGVAQLLCANDPRTAKHLVLLGSIAYDSFLEPGVSPIFVPRVQCGQRNRPLE